MNRYRAAIIGGGPAGAAASIQLKRYGIDFVLFEKNEIGGLLKNSNLVENYLGFPAGINGSQMVNLINTHLRNLDISFINEEVISCDYLKDYFHIKTRKNEYQSDFLIVASGTSPLKDNNISIEANAQPLIYYEITEIDINLINNAAIIGSGDGAFDYALNLSKKNVKAVIYMRSSESKALPLLIRRVEEDKNIDIVNNTFLERINYNKQIELVFDRNKIKFTAKADCVLFAIGREAELSFLNDSNIDRINDLETEKKLFFIGDVKNKIYRQASISSGDGILAAMQLFQQINKNKEDNDKSYK